MQRRIPAHVTKKFSLFPAEDRERLVDLLETLPLNQNNLAEILDLLSEISRRDGVSAVGIVEEGLGATRTIADPYKKIDPLKDFLRQKRFPLYHQKKVRFDTAIEKLNLPGSVWVNPSPFFEESFVEIRGKVEKGDDLKRLIEILESPAWTEIFEVIK